MNISKVTALYFSPTKNTRKVVGAIARNITDNVEEIDLTRQGNRAQRFTFGPDELVIIGAPVYGGRIPQIPDGIFDGVYGALTPAVYVVTYGNREYDDALLELSNLGKEKGFKTLAAAALVTPHTFFPEVAAGRPDDSDNEQLYKFVDDIIKKLKKKNPFEKELKIKGNFPYRIYKKAPFAPVASKKCNRCGTCVVVCPVKAIKSANPRYTERSNCILCFACVKNCPKHARDVRALTFKLGLKMLGKKLLKQRKEPEFFV
ncbi:ferredoxin [Elusimicrobium posterum]|uniref:EFR1 family ferrodoxin n=1 Tax=Elusimicrobium posterum TaxID=3116653 RepID=UPI003C78883B